MNKAYFLPLVLATAVTSAAFADELEAASYVDVYTNVFTGVNLVDEEGVPTAVGGTWTWTPTDVALTNVGNAVGFESEVDAVLRLNVTAVPQDENTIFRVTVTGTVEEVEMLMTNLDSNVQTAFAVCTNGSAAARCFWAWNGAEWQVLDTVPDGFNGSDPTNLTVEISYQGTNTTERPRSVRFTIGETALTNLVDGTGWVDLNTEANNLTGFGVNGSGTLGAVNGEVMLGVAEYDGVKYGTISGAVAAADAAGEASPKIEVVRETSEEIELPSTIDVTVVAKEEELGGGASGQYEIPLKITGGGKKDVKLPSSIAEYKEIVPNTIACEDGKVTFAIQTATKVLEDIRIEGTSITNNIAKLREFLEGNDATTGAYVAAGANATDIKAALETEGANGIKLYQSYELGIGQNESVKPEPVPAGSDEDSGKITLRIPSVIDRPRPGDFDVQYKVGDGAAQDLSTTDGKIKIPLESGSFPVKIIFTAK